MRSFWHCERTTASGSDGESRNAALRRLDWRFLVAQHHLDRAGGDPGSRQVIILDRFTRNGAREAYDTLAPGGWCYVEPTWGLGRARRLRQTLESLGFDDVACYWVWPPRRSAPAQFWVPVEADGAVDHFLRTRPRRKGSVRHLATRAVQRAWDICRRRGLTAPLCVVAQKPGPAEVTERSLAAQLRAGWADWGLGDTPPAVSCLMLTGGRSPLNKVVILVFASDETAPRLVVKFARVPEAVAGLQREASALGVVAERSLADGVDAPRVVFTTLFGGRWALGETPVTGTAFASVLTPEGYSRMAKRMAGVLASFADTAPRLPPSMWWDRLVEPVLTDFASRFCAVREIGAVDAIRVRLIGMPALPIVPEHRDCSPWNVLLTDRGRLALLDWESAEPAGLPALDLLYFLANASFLLDQTLGSGRELDTYTQLLQGSGWLGRIYSETVDGYCATVGIDATTLADLRTFGWMVHALAQPHAPEEKGPDTGEGNLFVALWRKDASLQHRRSV